MTDIFESESKQDSGDSTNNNNVLPYVFKLVEYRDKKRYQTNGENDGVAQIRLGFMTPQFNTVFTDDTFDSEPHKISKFSLWNQHHRQATKRKIFTQYAGCIFGPHIDISCDVLAVSFVSNIRRV